MEDFAEAHQDALKGVLDLSRGIPSHDTIGRVLSNIDPKSFSDLFQIFVSDLAGKVQGVVALGGAEAHLDSSWTSWIRGLSFDCFGSGGGTSSLILKTSFAGFHVSDPCAHIKALLSSVPLPTIARICSSENGPTGWLPCI